MSLFWVKISTGPTTMIVPWMTESSLHKYKAMSKSILKLNGSTNTYLKDCFLLSSMDKVEK